MRPGFILISGGVIFSRGRDALAGYYNPDLSNEDRACLAEAIRLDPPTVLIGADGYLRGYGNWPKEGLYCPGCDTFAVTDCTDRRHRAAAREANPPVAPLQPPPAVGPEVRTPDEYVCCICRQITPGGSEHPLDPCSLGLTTNLNKHPRYQRQAWMFCHFECLRRVSAHGILDSMNLTESANGTVQCEEAGFG
jgi:hypothetical protein